MLLGWSCFEMLFDPSVFYVVIAAVALVYSVISYILQRKIGNYKRIKEIQQHSKDLSEQMKQANASKDEARMKEVLQKQSAMMPMLSEMMMLQLKPLAFILIIFLAFVFVLDSIDPNRQLHTKIQMFDDGLEAHCDSKASDGAYSACYRLSGENYAMWLYTVDI
ncbi:DUF106 domain-containing protein, partial [Candidatus Parvarchaeota archaeon]|nr:DUF106 domain-containing protein [Candidatus Parvarchaeota archaeon]